MGVLAATNKIDGKFTPKDVDLLNTIAGTVAISIENARISDELKRAYDEVSALNQAKDRAINHLSHELKTPVSILGGALGMLEDALEGVSAGGVADAHGDDPAEPSADRRHPGRGGRYHEGSSRGWADGRWRRFSNSMRTSWR